MVVGAGKFDVGELVDGLLGMADKGRHFDGWGMAWAEGGEIRMHKSVGSCIGDTKLRELRSVESPLVVLHARKSSVRSYDETHPWLRMVDGVPYAFCYNGTFNFDGPDVYRPLGFVGDVFSRLAPGRELEAAGSVLDGLSRVFGANLVFLNPDSATVAVRYSVKPAHYRMALSAGDGHIIVSSEPVRREWADLNNRNWCKLGKDGSYMVGRF